MTTPILPPRIRRCGQWLKFFQVGNSIPYKMIQLNELKSVSIYNNRFKDNTIYTVEFNYIFAGPEKLQFDVFYSDEEKFISKMKYMTRKQLK